MIQSCDIQGSSDSSIQNVKVNDITSLLKQTHIQYIYTNGKKAHQLYSQYCYPITGIKDICLPSTSPANAAYSLERLLNSWKIICQEEGKEFYENKLKEENPINLIIARKFIFWLVVLMLGIALYLLLTRENNKGRLIFTIVQLLAMLFVLRIPAFIQEILSL